MPEGIGYPANNGATAGNSNETSAVMTNDPSKIAPAPAEKMTNWAYEPTIMDIQGDLEYAREENKNQSNNVQGWLALRNATGAESGKKTKLAGRSSVQPKLIRKHNEWRYPALSEPFLNTERMFNINPRTFEDKASADQNQLVLNWQFDTKIDKVAFVDKYVRKTVDEGTCIVRVGWDRQTEKVQVEKTVWNYFPLNPEEDGEQIKALSEATQMFMEDPDLFEVNIDIPESLKASVEYGMENQVAVYAE